MGGSYADVGGLNPVTGGSYAGAGNQTTRSTPESGYRRFSCRQSPKNLGGDGTTATHRWFNRRNFWKSGSLHFSNSDLNLMLTNPMIGGRFGLHLKKIGSGRRCASRRRTREWT
ncbi:hypothetical protein BHE74_00059264 [Ensete ventricosum]|nr:hypothetical protein BHE74_00059264 [Ensete ventricosum]